MWAGRCLTFVNLNDGGCDSTPPCGLAPKPLAHERHQPHRFAAFLQTLTMADLPEDEYYTPRLRVERLIQSGVFSHIFLPADHGVLLTTSFRALSSSTSTVLAGHSTRGSGCMMVTYSSITKHNVARDL